MFFTLFTGGKMLGKPLTEQGGSHNSCTHTHCSLGTVVFTLNVPLNVNGETVLCLVSGQ